MRRRTAGKNSAAHRTCRRQAHTNCARQKCTTLSNPRFPA
jgi:ribosomal protein L4